MCDFFDFDVQDWMFIGPLAEDLADDDEKQRQLENDYDPDQDNEEDF